MADKLKEYQEGFNHGYILSKYLPDLADQITKSSNPENEYFTGLIHGKREHELEKTREGLKSPSVDNSPSKGFEKDKERDKE